MQTYHVRLQSDIFGSFRCVRAADSLDIDVKKKSIHELNISADLETPFSIGVIVGASGSGKTTLAKQIFGEDCFKVIADLERPVIDQLPSEMTYEECADTLAGIGLTSVPCWIRQMKTLSNGQRARAEAALAMTASDEIVVLDEWTSVVDRTVAKVMSHCVQKFAKRRKKKIVLLSCHYDVLEWLDPDWIIDCNSQAFIDRRLLQPSERQRRETIAFEIREVDKRTWRYFSKYHYLSDKLPNGKIYTFGIFHGDDQIGFQCFANYVPPVKGKKKIFHSNRTVIHPDYAGMGLGIRVINETSRIMSSRGVRVMAKFSSIPIYRSMIKNTEWRLLETKRQIGRMQQGNISRRQATFRTNVTTFSFEFVGAPK
jgi:ABC-type dipeptide/oligopeptide/nickel transport system ATPase subunit